jgi:predicted methyltransferase
VSRQAILSHIQCTALLAARGSGQTACAASLDLGLTQEDVGIGPAGIMLPDGTAVAWDVIQRIARDQNSCFLVGDGPARKIQVFSDALNRHYSLFPTEGAPTMLVAGFTMHRITGIDPWRDTELKVTALKPIRGRALDICTGLGYSAIQLAVSAERVTTVEIDPAALEIGRLNPWSRELFENPKIEQAIGDAAAVLTGFADGAFDVILHDPPTVSLAGQLYGAVFYRTLRRLLRPSGRLFHYTGDPGSKAGSRVTSGVIRRLREAGFRRVTPLPRAFGVIARP